VWKNHGLFSDTSTKLAAVYHPICGKKITFFGMESISKKEFMKYFATLLRIQENKKKY
jgi:hypothetical protein